MINEQKTFELFGYYSYNLKPKSNKKIICICEVCGKERISSKNAYCNLCRSCSKKGKNHPMYGKHLSEEHKRKISEANKGENNPMYGKIGKKSPNYGKHHSEETKKKMSKAHKGKKLSEETKKKLSESHKGENSSMYGKTGKKCHNYGKHHSKETRKKMSENQKGKNNPMYGKTGKKAPRWQGGISFEPYCPTFNKLLKEQVRNYFNRKCLLCKKTEEENKRKLDVHHINYNKNQGCDDEKWLLCILCRSCHTKTNGNREKWERILTEKVQNYRLQKEKVWSD